ncbi:MAG: histidine phosphatase family protein [Patescibacteria group bacterium]
MKKIIYFVRHGESEANVSTQARSINPLTEKGIEQARILGERFKNIKIEKLIETSKKRSKQTAEAISLATSIPVTENDLFIEREGEFEAMFEHKHLGVRELTEIMKKKLNKEHWEYAKQELWDVLIERVKQAAAYLENLPENTIAIVTHGAFLKVLVAYLIFKDALTEEQTVMFMAGTGTTNTGITVCKFYGDLHTWRLITWNDGSHLE